MILEAADPAVALLSVGGNFEGTGSDAQIPDVGNDWGAVFLQIR